MTNKQEHTPGPWSYVYDGSSDWTIGQYPDPQSNPVCSIWCKNDKKAIANAQLIASAPDLKCHNKRLRKHLKDYMNLHEYHMRRMPHSNEIELQEWDKLYRRAYETIEEIEKTKKGE